MDAGAALSALDWWREAGVDTLVDDAPRNWLSAPAAAEVRPAPASAPRQSPTSAPLPDSLPALSAWIADPANLPSLGRNRIAASGDPASNLMILADMPERDDRAALMDGDVGRLFDRMLAAIGRDRASVYLAAFCPARVAGGRATDALRPELAALARRHVALAAPRHLLLFGQGPAHAFGLTMQDRGRLHRLNHDGGTTSAVVTFTPRFLIQSPARKADAWADLRLWLEDQAS